MWKTRNIGIHMRMTKFEDQMKKWLKIFTIFLDTFDPLQVKRVQIMRKFGNKKRKDRKRS